MHDASTVATDGQQGDKMTLVICRYCGQRCEGPLGLAEHCAKDHRDDLAARRQMQLWPVDYRRPRRHPTTISQQMRGQGIEVTICIDETADAAKIERVCAAICTAMLDGGDAA